MNRKQSRGKKTHTEEEKKRSSPDDKHMRSSNWIHLSSNWVVGTWVDPGTNNPFISSQDSRVPVERGL